VVDVYADREPEGRAKSGYIVEVIANAEAIPRSEGLTVPAQLGGPAEIRLYSPLFPAVDMPAAEDALPVALAGRHVPNLGSADAE
jgi:hypothetical protein